MVDKNSHLLLGWTCVVMAPIWFLFSVWDFKTRLCGLIGLSLFGIASLYLGYSEKKELKKIKEGLK